MRRKRLLLAVGMVTLGGCTLERRTDRAPEEVPEPSASEFLKPWGDSIAPAGVKSGDLVWIWAMAGTVPESGPPRLVEGGIASETRQALDNVVAVLGSAGATSRDVAQCSVFLADAGELEAMTQVYREFFPAAPRRVAAMASGLALGARVEIECTAVISSTP